jgi:hypothetical protein
MMTDAGMPSTGGASATSGLRRANGAMPAKGSAQRSPGNHDAITGRG